MAESDHVPLVDYSTPPWTGRSGPATTIARQTAALFLDAYRELNARRMFWITLVLSGLVVAAFATVGINERGWSVLWINVPSWVNTTLVPREMFYKLVFSNFAVSYWLNWLAIILALISTASIIPEFISGGSVDLYLSKPVSRVRLFLTKYATGLLFVGLQVSVFTAACFILIGIRTGSWDLRLFLAIVVVLLVFSYLFCFCALIGLLTRSTVASLLLTILFWLGLFGIGTAEHLLHMASIAGRIESEAYANQFSYSDKEIALFSEQVTKGTTTQPVLDAARKRRQELEEKKRKSDPQRRNIATAYRILASVKAVLPKTRDTNDLLIRWLNVDDTEIDEEQLRRRDERRAARAGATRGGWLSGFKDRTEVSLDDTEVIRELQNYLEQRPAAKIIGTSLGFEIAVLALACWIFTRRDY